VDLDFAGDWFNHYGMKELVERFDEALELICDRHTKKWNNFAQETIREIHTQALKLYGLLHSRWIVQPRGLAQMKEKFEKGVFGECPRFSCNGQHVLPVGESGNPGCHSCKLFCPQCCDIYRPDDVLVDGADFGTAFPHIFLIEFPRFNARSAFATFQPNVFGFRLYEDPDRFCGHRYATEVESNGTNNESDQNSEEESG
jgi:casein kinase II subunit beta